MKKKKGITSFGKSSLVNYKKKINRSTVSPAHKRKTEQTNSKQKQSRKILKNGYKIMSPWNIMVMIMVKIATSRTGQFSEKNALLQKIGNKKKKARKSHIQKKRNFKPMRGFPVFVARACSGSAEGA